MEQIAFADRIILNKIDLVSPEELSNVIEEIRAINQNVEIIHSQYSKVDPKLLINIQAFSLRNILKTSPSLSKPHNEEK